MSFNNDITALEQLGPDFDIKPKNAMVDLKQIELIRHIKKEQAELSRFKQKLQQAKNLDGEESGDIYPEAAVAEMPIL